MRGLVRTIIADDHAITSARLEAASVDRDELTVSGERRTVKPFTGC